MFKELKDNMVACVKIFILLAVIGGCLFGCSDDKKQNANNVNIVGTWRAEGNAIKYNLFFRANGYFFYSGIDINDTPSDGDGLYTLTGVAIRGKASGYPNECNLIATVSGGVMTGTVCGHTFISTAHMPGEKYPDYPFYWTETDKMGR